MLGQRCHRQRTHKRHGSADRTAQPIQRRWHDVALLWVHASEYYYCPTLPFLVQPGAIEFLSNPDDNDYLKVLSAPPVLEHEAERFEVIFGVAGGAQDGGAGLALAALWVQHRPTAHLYT